MFLKHKMSDPLGGSSQFKYYPYLLALSNPKKIAGAGAFPPLRPPLGHRCAARTKSQSGGFVVAGGGVSEIEAKCFCKRKRTGCVLRARDVFVIQFLCMAKMSNVVSAPVDTLALWGAVCFFLMSSRKRGRSTDTGAVARAPKRAR
jgi:hypothetical protein